MIRLFSLLIVTCVLFHVNARFCPTCETAEDFRKAKFLAENLRSLNRALERSSERDGKTTAKLHELCEASPLHDKEKNLMTEIDNLDTQIQSTTKEGDAYKVSDELQNNLQNARSDFEAKKSVFEPMKEARNIMMKQREDFGDTLQSLSVRWQNFKLNFESGLKGNSDVDLSFLETSKRTRRMRAKKRQQQERVISSSEPNDVFVTMTANIGALRDAIHGAQADVAMDAANNDASVDTVLTNAETEVEDAKSLLTQYEKDVENLKLERNKITDQVNELEGEKGKVETKLEEVRSKMKDEPCDLYQSEFSRRHDHRETLAKSIESIAKLIGTNPRCCACGTQCEAGVSRCGDCNSK